MRIALSLAFLLCHLGIAHAQDKDPAKDTPQANAKDDEKEKKCAVVAYAASGGFGAAFNYESCKDAQDAAIAACERVVADKDRADCHDQPRVQRGGWIQILFCKMNKDWTTRTSGHKTKEGLAERTAVWIQESQYSESHCKTVPGGLFHAEGEHAGYTLPKVISGEPQYTVRWIAVAGGFGGNSVGVGYSSPKSTRAEAEAAALEQCNENGSVNCKDPHARDDGCLYIVPGKKRGRTTWGRGSTEQEALNECRRGGYSCSNDKVIGGCAN